MAALATLDTDTRTRRGDRTAGKPATLAAPFIGVPLHQAAQRYEAEFDEAMKKAGLDHLTIRQLHVLSAVLDHPACSQTDLVEATGVDRSTLADIVRRLVKRRWLERKRTKEDQRAYAVKLTAAGQAALDKARPIVTRIDAGLGQEILRSLRRT